MPSQIGFGKTQREYIVQVMTDAEGLFGMYWKGYLAGFSMRMKTVKSSLSLLPLGH